MENNKKILGILGVISIFLVLTGASYALFNYIKQGTKENSLKTGTITFLYSELSSVGRGISIQEALPMSDEQGKLLIGEGKVFDFKITSDTMNKSAINYEITVEKKIGSTLPDGALKVYLTEVSGSKEREITLDKYENLLKTSMGSKENEKKLYDGVVPSNVGKYEKHYRLRMWMDENAGIHDEQYAGKTFTLTVNVYANGKVISEEEVELESNTNIDRIIGNSQEFKKVENKEYNYELSLPYGTDKLDMDIIPTNSRASVEIEKLTETEKSSIQAMSIRKSFQLDPNDNYFKIMVTSENKKKEKEYIIKVTVLKDSDNALKTLDIENCTLSKEFDKDTTEYSCTVEQNTINIVGEANSINASIEGLGEKDLSWGSNIVVIKVKAQNEEEKIYTVTVNNQRPTSPVITGGSSSWVATAPTISVSNVGSAVSGVKNYEYYKTTSTTSPTDDTQATGTTSGNITVSDEGTTYVYYRTISNNGNKSVWSNIQTVKLDTTNPPSPTVSKVENNGSNIKLSYNTVTDISSVVKYRCYYGSNYIESTTGSCTISTTPGETYNYKVCAVNGSGLEGCSNQASVTTFTGIPSGTYSEGQVINYAGNSWKVIYDHGNNTTLVLASHYKTGAYGGSAWSNSSAKSIVNTNFVNDYSILKNDINNGGILYDDTSASYVRIPKRNEVTKKLSNNGGLPFWTVDVSGSHAAYATASGELSYTTYTKGSQVTGYTGYSTSSLAAISHKFDAISNDTYLGGPCVNVTTGTNSSLYAQLSATTVVNNQKCTPSYGSPWVSTMYYSGSSNPPGYYEHKLQVNYHGYKRYLTDNYVNDATAYKTLCYCNYNITVAECKSKVEQKYSCTCDNTLVYPGTSDVTIYFANGGYAHTWNNTISNNTQAISYRPVITVRER